MFPDKCGLRQSAEMHLDCDHNHLVIAPRSPDTFVEWLVAGYAAIAQLEREHLAEYGELLPHVLFGDVTRYAAELARVGGDAEETLDRLLADLDAALAANPNDEVGNLICVSFVENAQGVAGDAEEPLRVRIRTFPHLAHALT
jgi:hypothetical protein